MTMRFHSLILLFALAALSASRAPAAMPESIRYQGRLLQAGGVPVNGSVAIGVRLYDTQTGGTLLWTQDVTTVSVAEGLYDLAIGGVGFANALNGGDAWIELEVAGETLTPRQRMPSAPYAFYAENLSGPVAHVDRVNGRVAIGHEAPTATLDIDGQIQLRGGNPHPGYVLHAGTDGTADWRAASGAPQGLIVMWLGNPTNVPTGWALCDGMNGTPNLTHRFVRGAGGAFNEGVTGGATSHIHAVDVPATSSSTDGGHTHTASFSSTTTSTGGSHTHSADPPNAGTSSVGNHSHSGGDLSYHQNCSTIGASIGGMSGDYWFFGYTSGSKSFRYAPSWEGSVGSAGGHNHNYNIGSFTSGSAGDHSHTVTLPTTTSSSAGSHAHTWDPAPANSDAADTLPPYSVVCFIMKQ